MGIIILSFAAGVLTVLAPCVFPLLPVIIGGSVQERDPKRPYIIIGSLAVFVILFTVLLKFGEGILSISDQHLRIFSGVVIILFGVALVFPKIWGQISYKLGFSTSSDKILNDASTKRGIFGQILTGGALGPVFTSCSPTYLVIIGLSFQEDDFFKAFLYLISYVAGLCAILLLVSIWGQKVIHRLKWATNPNGIFKKFIGVLFILVGVMVIFSLEKRIQESLLEIPFYENLYKFELNLLPEEL